MHDGGLNSKTKDVVKRSHQHLHDKGKEEGRPFHFYVFCHTNPESLENHTVVLIPRDYYAGENMLCGVFGENFKCNGAFIGNRDRMKKEVCVAIFGTVGWHNEALFTEIGGRKIYRTFWFPEEAAANRNVTHALRSRIKNTLNSLGPEHCSQAEHDELTSMRWTAEQLQTILQDILQKMEAGAEVFMKDYLP